MQDSMQSPGSDSPEQGGDGSRSMLLGEGPKQSGGDYTAETASSLKSRHPPQILLDLGIRRAL